MSQASEQTHSSMMDRIKRKIRYMMALPHHIYGLCGCFFYDLKRYYRAASKGHEAVRACTPRYTELKSWIAADAHKIEKALSLQAPRPGFGLPVVRRLMENLQTFHRDFEPERTTHVAVTTLRAYCQFNRDNEFNVDDIDTQVQALEKEAEQSTCYTSEGGVVTLTRESIFSQAQLPGIEQFFSSRYSARNFTDEPVDYSKVEAAVRMAQKTPSVCNRQSWKAYLYLDKEEKEAVLGCQEGNRGFGDLATGVIVVTSDLSTFFSYGERNQAWIDGGMFAMSLVYGLHAVGIGSCCLNWSVEPERDKLLHDVTGIPENDVVIMMIAIGNLPDELNVAQSVRKNIDEILVVKPIEKRNQDR